MSLRYLLMPQLVAAREFGEVLGISAPGPHVPGIEAAGIRHIALTASTRGMNLRSDLVAAIQLWRILRRERVLVLHTHNPKPGVYGRLIGRLAGVPLIVNTIHGLYATERSSIARRAVVYSLEAFASRFSDAELVQNPEDFELVTRWRITPPKKTSYLGNGVDLTRFNPERARGLRRAAREELGVGENEVLVGMVGRLVTEKGIPELIAAAEQLRGRLTFIVVGPDDPEKDDALPRELMGRGKAAGVRFMGMREDVDVLYAAFDVFVLPSHREGFPRAAMEAAASGLPLVATDIRGCRQVVDHGTNGFLFPLGDVDAMVRHLTRLGEDEGLRDQMGRASSARAVELFDEKLVVKKVIDSYRRAAADKGLGWWYLDSDDPAIVRPAQIRDVPALAQLHAKLIGSGFLSSLGPGLLELIYETMVNDPDSRVFVAELDGVVAGFVAGTANTGGLYRRFIGRHFLKAALLVIPRLLSWPTVRRIYETLRYGSDPARSSAELLSMGVAPGARRRQLGHTLVTELLAWARGTGVTSMKVVVGADNEAATRLYNKCGFTDGRRIEMHAETESWEFLWSA